MCLKSVVIEKIFYIVWKRRSLYLNRMAPTCKSSISHPREIGLHQKELFFRLFFLGFFSISLFFASSLEGFSKVRDVAPCSLFSSSPSAPDSILQRSREFQKKARGNLEISEAEAHLPLRLYWQAIVVSKLGDSFWIIHDTLRKLIGTVTSIKVPPLGIEHHISFSAHYRGRNIYDAFKVFSLNLFLFS